MKKTLKGKRGITLVALVITIIVLLILAGITINLTVGQGGILTTAQQAGKNYVASADDEQSQITDFFGETEQIINGMEIEIPECWTATTSKDNDWYSYGGVTVNVPKLTGKMTPIKYTGDLTGETNLWANAITADGSMWVWIPRFAYKIPSGSHTNVASTIEIAFIDINNNFLNSEDTGEITDDTTVEGAGTTVWLVHPAFTSNVNNGGWDRELTGIWFAKFEATGTRTTLTVKPGESSLRSLTINVQYKLARTSTFGESLTAEELGSHMAKNSEWGAVAYLGQSSYGTKGNKVEKNTSSDCYTGGSDNPTKIYTDNKTQSTTYNATGVYDMNGGAWEYVASYAYYADSSNLGNYGGTSEGDLYGVEKVAGATTENREDSNKYKTVYPTSYDECLTIKGDAIYETSSKESNSGAAWYDVSASFPSSTGPFLCRSGDYDSSSGLFWYKGDSGCGNNRDSFRPVIIGK